MYKALLTFMICCVTCISFAQTKDFKYSISKKGDYIFTRQLDNYKGKYLILHYANTVKDELIVFNLETNKPIVMPGFSGKPYQIYLDESNDLLCILTAYDYEKNGNDGMPKCFIYDMVTLSLKHTITGNYYRILSVTDKNIILQGQEGKDLHYFSLITGLKEKVYTLKVPKRYYGVFASSLTNDKFICVIDSSEKTQKIYWEDLKTGDNSIHEIPNTFKVISSDTFGSKIKWIATLKENQPYGEQKMLVWAIDFNTGKIVYDYKSDLLIKKLKVNQLDGRVILQCSGNDEMLTVKNGKVESVPLDVDADNIYWTPDNKNLVCTGYGKLFVYNIQMSQIDFLIESDINGDRVVYDLISFLRGTNKLFYADNGNDKNLKLGVLELKYPKNINFSFPVNLMEKTPVLIIQDGHRETPTDIAFYNQKNLMITGDESGAITIWDAQNNLQLRKIKLQKGENWEEKGNLLLAVHPFHEIIAVSWQYKFIQFIDFYGHEIFRLATDGQSNLIHFSEDGNYFYFEKENSKMAVFNLKESRIEITYPFNTVSTIYNYSFNFNSTKIALPQKNRTIAILEALTGKIINTIQTAHEKPIYLVAFHPSDSAVASLDEYMNVVVSSLYTKQSNTVINGNNKMGSSNVKDSVISVTPYISQILFTADGQLLIPGGMGSGMDGGSIYNLLGGDYLSGKYHFSNWELYKNTSTIAYFSKVALGGDKRTIWSVHKNNSIEVWDSHKKTHLKSITGNKETIIEINASNKFNGFTTGQSSSSLNTWNFDNSEFKNYDGVKYGNSLFHFNKDNTSYAHFFDDIIKVNLNKDEIISRTEHDYYSYWVSMTPHGAIVYDDNKLLLLSPNSKDKKTLYRFKKESSYYWSGERIRNFYCLDAEKENLFFYNPTEFKTLQLVQIQLTSGKIIYHPIDLPDEGDINSFDFINNSILITGKNNVYRYNLSTKTIIKERDLTQAAIFKESFYPSLLKTNKKGLVAAYYQKSEVGENYKREMVLDIFFENNPLLATINIPVKNHLIRDIEFGFDEKQVFICYEKEVEIWDLQDAKLLATLAILPQNKYILYTRDNYYFSSNKLTDIGFRLNEKIYDLAQFDAKYNRPDKVLEAVGCKDTALINSYKKAYFKRIKKLGIDTTSFLGGYSVPESDFENRDAIEYLQKNEKLTLHIRGIDSTYKLDRYNIWTNEVPLFGQKGFNIKKRNKNDLDTTITIQLSQGENRIETSVLNVNGTESYRMPLIVNYTPEKSENEKIHFIGIGIDKFADSTYNLQYSAKDIRDLSKKLKEKFGDTISIDTLFNNDVTVDNIKSLKKKLLKTSVNDKVIISYSGHGLLGKGYDYYLSTYSINFEKPEQNGLPYEEFENLLDSIPARKKLMLIDACHSGEVDKDEQLAINIMADSLGLSKPKGAHSINNKTMKQLGLKNSFELMQSLFVNIGKSTGAIIISAAAGNQFALEKGNLRNGVFTYCILEAMNNNPTITVSQLKATVAKRVEEITNGLQKPTSRNETINSDWKIW